MGFFNTIINKYAAKRLSEIDNFKKNPIQTQEKIFFDLILKAKNTEFGKKYQYSTIKNYNDFKQNVPVQEYETLKPYIERLLNGEQNIFFPQKINWFAKSSGTTDARSKFIPISKDFLESCHFQGGNDVFFIYNNSFPNTKVFSKKTLSIGGCTSISKNGNARIGDLSAVIISNLPTWSQINTINKKIVLIPEWDKKLDQIVKSTYNKDISQIIGVPSWLKVLLENLLDFTGKNNILEIWHNLELFVHGGISFSPYKESYKKLIPSEKMNYLETYNASEGFFGIQDEFITKKNDFLLMLDYGIFYEFIELTDYHKNNLKTIPLSEVKTDVNYVLVISTNGGLWRYIIGDTVQFTSKNPYKFIITGRTKHFINCFGEELMIHNADTAIAYACKKTNSNIKEYTAAPLFYENNESQGTHEWLFEFEKEPENIDVFVKLLDEKLREVNSDYDAKRFKNITIGFPKYTIVPKGTFLKWLETNKKLGGQNKVQRLSNNRKFLESLFP